MLERDDFEKRFKSQRPISLHEFLYPLAQGMDSVAIRSDVELGGTDQKFNLLIGRELQRQYGQEPQVILTLPLLEGTDGVEKMSKAYDNYVAFNDSPDDIYGKVMSIPDGLIFSWFLLLTDAQQERISALRKQIAGGANPRDAKRELARTLVAMYHNSEAAEQAEERFERIFSSKLPPEEMDLYFAEWTARETILDVIVKAGLVASKNEGRSMFKQSAVSIDGMKQTDPSALLPDVPECVIKVGKRRFLRVLRNNPRN
jgi:tyrosyl-tRNA synthetase